MKNFELLSGNFSYCTAPFGDVGVGLETYWIFVSGKFGSRGLGQ